LHDFRTDTFNCHATIYLIHGDLLLCTLVIYSLYANTYETAVFHQNPFLLTHQHCVVKVIRSNNGCGQGPNTDTSGPQSVPKTDKPNTRNPASQGYPRQEFCHCQGHSHILRLRPLHLIWPLGSLHHSHSEAIYAKSY